MLVHVLSGFHSIQEIIILCVPTRSLVAANLAFNFIAKVLDSMDVASRLFIRAIRGIGALNWNFDNVDVGAVWM